MDGAQQLKITCLGITLYISSLMAARTFLPPAKPAGQHPAITLQASGDTDNRENQTFFIRKKTEKQELSKL